MVAIRRALLTGEVLFRQGEPSDYAWLIESGTIELVREPAPGEAGGRVAHGTFGPGELIGELGLIEGAADSVQGVRRKGQQPAVPEHLERPLDRALVRLLRIHFYDGRGGVGHVPAVYPVRDRGARRLTAEP